MNIKYKIIQQMSKKVYINKQYKGVRIQNPSFRM